MRYASASHISFSLGIIAHWALVWLTYSLSFTVLAWSVESVGTSCRREALAVGGLHPYRWFAYWTGCALLLAKGKA